MSQVSFTFVTARFRSSRLEGLSLMSLKWKRLACDNSFILHGGLVLTIVHFPKYHKDTHILGKALPDTCRPLALYPSISTTHGSCNAVDSLPPLPTSNRAARALRPIDFFRPRTCTKVQAARVYMLRVSRFCSSS